MLRSTDRVRTTHVGSLARPAALLDLMRAAAQGRAVDPGELAEAERRAVADVVARSAPPGWPRPGCGPDRARPAGYAANWLQGGSRTMIADAQTIRRPSHVTDRPVPERHRDRHHPGVRRVERRRDAE